MRNNIISENQKAFTDYYNIRPRLIYPNLMFVHYLMKFVKPDPTVKTGLSIGCGDGAHEFVAVRQGISMMCTDVTEVAVERIKRWAKDEGLEIQTSLCDQTDLSRFPDNIFDFVISWAVMSYGTPDIGKKAISEIYRVLRPGGHLIGTLESSTHTGYKQEGARKLGERTYQMPKEVKISQPNMVLTYYDEKEVREFLNNFVQVDLALDVLYPPNMLKEKIGQWMFHCLK